MSDPIRLAVLGANGRMGRAVIRLALTDSRFKLAGAQSRAGSEYVGQDVAALAGRPPCGVAVAATIEQAITNADAVVDFTRPELTQLAAEECVQQGKALVSGTTGLSQAQQKVLQAASASIPVFWAPNMSVGVNVLLAALHDVAVRLGDDYDAEIVETHHRHKVDAPSGTAIALADVLATVRGQPLSELADYGRQGHSGQRQTGRIGMHSLRGGEIVGEHDVRLIAAGEEIRLGHRAFSRDAFASGALRAAAWLHGRGAGFYSMRDLLGNAAAPRG